MFQQLTILGPGLLGASLGLATKERGLCTRVVAWSRREETRANCALQSWCDEVFAFPEAAVTDSDLVVICTPVETIAPLLALVGPSLKVGAIVTDVGSTKSLICRAAASALSDSQGRFIGSHPMAGSEQAGMEHARTNLFENAACIITPTPGDEASPENTAEIRTFWEALGMRVTALSPEKHDEVVAHISHLPHLLASALCGYLSTKDPQWAELSGGGLRDTTRVASGDPFLWQQIVSQNKNELLRALNGFENELQDLRSALLSEDPSATAAFLQRGKTYRDRLAPRPIS